MSDIEQALRGPLPGNTEAEYAEQGLVLMDNEVEGSPAYTELSREAQIHATLAVAYEQRTANLLTWLEAIDGRASHTEVSELSGDIRKRLGLGQP